MRGGAIEYSPLPCDSNGNTDWNSTQQVGHETCVKYGTDGAESDNRAGGLGANLSSKDITQTIKNTIDETLKDISKKELLNSQGTYQVNQDAQKLADSIAQQRLAARQTTAASQ